MKRTPLRQRVNKVIPICGRKFDIRYTSRLIGGEFHTIDPETKSGKIEIGEGRTDEFYMLSNIFHEIMEIVLTLNNLRWADPDQRIIFCMTHDQFADFVLQVTRSVIEAGLIKIKEPGVK